MQFNYQPILNALLLMGSHISTWMFLSGALKLGIGGLERTADPRIKTPTGDVRREISLPFGVGQVVIGIFSFWTLGMYLFSILQGRPAGFPAVVTIATLAGGGAAGFAAATRDVPWAIVSGTGIGLLGGYAIFNMAAGSAAGAALGVIFGIFAFYGVWILLKPSEDWLRNFGQLTSFTPAASLIGMVEISIAVLTAAGIMVL